LEALVLKEQPARFREAQVVWIANPLIARRVENFEDLRTGKPVERPNESPRENAASHNGVES